MENPCSTDFFGKCQIASIRDLGVLSVWKERNFLLGGEKWSLDDIEGLLRGVECEDDGCDPKKYPANVPMPIPSKEIDYRLHSAIVCASISCPDLARTAYFSETLDEQLDEAFNSFMDNPKKGLRVHDGTITVSPIFNWFYSDFEKSALVPHDKDNNAALEYIYHNLRDDHPAKDHLKNNLQEMPLFFMYNWNMNAKRGHQVPCLAAGGGDNHTHTCLSWIMQLQLLVAGGVGAISLCVCCATLGCCTLVILACCCCSLMRRSRNKRRSQGYMIQD